MGISLVFLILFLVILVSGCSSQKLPNSSNTDDLINSITTTDNLTNKNYIITIILVDETTLDVLETYDRTVVIGNDFIYYL